MNFIYDRRSIRKFQKKDIPIEYIYEMINAGRAAPSAKNRQPWRYIVFGNEKKNEFLAAMKAGLTREESGISYLPQSKSGIADARNTLRVMEEAPVIIVVLNTNAKSPFLPIDNDAHVAEICDTLSIGASIENIILTGEELGLGTLWIANTCFAYSELTAYLNTKYQLVGAVAVGYADEKPPKRSRKKWEEIAELRF